MLIHFFFQKQFTLLICAAHNNKVEVVDYLLTTLPDLEVDAKDSDGQTALYHAALGGHRAVLQRLVEANADPDTKNKVRLLKLKQLFYYYAMLFSLI